MKKIKQILAIILSAIMASALTGCEANWFVKSGDIEISEGIYTYYAIKACDEAYALRDDMDISIWKSTIDGESAADWIRERATELSKGYIMIAGMFEECGLTLSDENKEEISSRVYDEYWLDGLREFYGPLGVDEELYTELVTKEVKAAQLIEYYRADLEKDISDEDINDYLRENYASFMYISVAYYYQDISETDEPAEAIDMKYFYEYLCSQIEAGAAVESLITQILNGELVVNPGLAEMEKACVNTSANGNERTDLAADINSTSYPVTFMAELVGTNVGEVIYYDDTSNLSYNIAQRTDIFADDGFINEYKEEIIRYLLRKNFNAMVDELILEQEFKINTGRVKKIDLSELI